MQQQLKIEVHSFSYKKKGYPIDNSGNGGGFCFDCRGILNPGRIEEYKPQTGADIAVQEYLETQTLMPQFLEGVKNVISITIENYLERGFDNLQVNFGCTGGQHRSVYSAIKIGAYHHEKYPQAEVVVIHDEQTQLH